MYNENSIEALKLDTERLCKQCGKTYFGKGNSKYCSKLCLSKNNYEANMLKPEWRLGKLLSMAKNRSSSRGHEFNLDLEHLLTLWDGKCSLSGIELDLSRSDKGVVNPYAPSLDRIEPKLGYTKGNVRIVCYQMNVAMSEFGLDQFNSFINLYIKSGVAFR